MYELPFETIQKAAAQGLAIANDFGHTAANCLSNSSQEVWTFLKQHTHAFSPYTKLLHITYLVSPYNGTDFHDQLDNPIFDTPDAVPNKKHMIYPHNSGLQLLCWNHLKVIG